MIAPFSHRLLYRKPLKQVKKIDVTVNKKARSEERAGAYCLELPFFEDESILLQFEEVFVVDHFLHE